MSKKPSEIIEDYSTFWQLIENWADSQTGGHAKEKSKVILQWLDENLPSGDPMEEAEIARLKGVDYAWQGVWDALYSVWPAWRGEVADNYPTGREGVIETIKALAAGRHLECKPECESEATGEPAAYVDPSAGSAEPTCGNTDPEPRRNYVESHHYPAIPDGYAFSKVGDLVSIAPLNEVAGEASAIPYDANIEAAENFIRKVFEMLGMETISTENRINYCTAINILTGTVARADEYSKKSSEINPMKRVRATLGMGIEGPLEDDVVINFLKNQLEKFDKFSAIAGDMLKVQKALGGSAQSWIDISVVLAEIEHRKKNEKEAIDKQLEATGKLIAANLTIEDLQRINTAQLEMINKLNTKVGDKEAEFASQVESNRLLSARCKVLDDALIRNTARINELLKNDPSGVEVIKPEIFIRGEVSFQETRQAMMKGLEKVYQSAGFVSPKDDAHWSQTGTQTETLAMDDTYQAWVSPAGVAVTYKLSDEYIPDVPRKADGPFSISSWLQWRHILTVIHGVVEKQLAGYVGNPNFPEFPSSDVIAATMFNVLRQGVADHGLLGDRFDHMDFFNRNCLIDRMNDALLTLQGIADKEPADLPGWPGTSDIADKVFIELSGGKWGRNEVK